MTSILRHEFPYDTHHGMVINRAKFDTCTSSCFRGVKTDTQTDRIALYSIDEKNLPEVKAIVKNIEGSGN